MTGTTQRWRRRQRERISWGREEEGGGGGEWEEGEEGSSCGVRVLQEVPSVYQVSIVLRWYIQHSRTLKVFLFQTGNLLLS